MDTKSEGDAAIVHHPTFLNWSLIASLGQPRIIPLSTQELFKMLCLSYGATMLVFVKLLLITSAGVKASADFHHTFFGGSDNQAGLPRLGSRIKPSPTCHLMPQRRAAAQRFIGTSQVTRCLWGTLVWPSVSAVGAGLASVVEMGDDGE